MDKTVINIKTDKKLKTQAQKTAKELGIPLGTLINAYLREFVRERRVSFNAGPVPNAKTRKELEEIEEDIREGRNSVGPFEVDEALEYLRSLE